MVERPKFITKTITLREDQYLELMQDSLSKGVSFSASLRMFLAELQQRREQQK